MNAKKFSDAMSELDTKYVDEAPNYKKKAGKKKKKQNWTKWGAMAACLCLVIVPSMSMLEPAVSDFTKMISFPLSKVAMSVLFLNNPL